MALFLTSCMEGMSLPDFPQIKNQPSEAADSSQGSRKTGRDVEFAPVRKVKTETLLETTGNWNLIEQGGAMDPTQAHLAARQKVNTKRRKKSSELTAHFEPDAKSGEDGKLRVLRLEADDSGFEDYDVAESSFVKPTHTVAEGDLLQKIKSLFGENDESSQKFSVVVPKRKPSRSDQVEKSVALAKAYKKPTSSEDRIVNGFIIPPDLPERRKKVKNVVVREIPVAVKTSQFQKEKIQETPVQVSKGEKIIVPKRKPVRRVSSAVRTAPAPYTPTKKAKKAQTPVYENGAMSGKRASAIKLRSGKHTGKTRLVIEVTRTTKYKVAIDHVRNVLRVKLYNTRWSLDRQDSFTKSNLLGTYIAREHRDGSVLFEVRLKKKTKIVNTMILRPNISSKHRVVIDLQD